MNAGKNSNRESSNGKLRDERFSGEMIYSFKEAETSLSNDTSVTTQSGRPHH